ncbi:helix-turn-helix domain-containing protein [Hominifimenecus sp. rT4P-3]|uniref:helix-turn-helix domain-containing protein n=1 Tax=Hominifimenecus sp. rT4P-3 TaxID=3242979 RepID=UPI003DA57FAC
MILADKISLLRKKSGWSQEDLAEQLNVSRQSISKWESAVSIPDLDKIIKLSQIFGVTTDYLLKDDQGEEDLVFIKSEGDSAMRKITLEEASTYMELVQKSSRRIAPAVSACIVSPIVLLYLLGLSQAPDAVLPHGAALGIGLIVLLVLITGAVATFITTGIPLEKYQFLEKEVFELEYGISGLVQEKKAKHEPTFIKGIVLGVILCIVSVIPLVTVSVLGYSQLTVLLCLDLLLIIVSAAVFLFIRVGMIHDSYQKLLQTGDYSIERKIISKKIGPVAGIYWCMVAAAYLLLSFLTMKWGRTWIIWPCAGVLFGAITVFLSQKNSKK